MSNTTADTIRKAALGAVVPEEQVHVDEWDADILIRGMTAGAAVDFYATATKTVKGNTEVDRKKWGPGLLIACVFDLEGKPVFEAAHQDSISAMPSATVTELAGIAARLSGLGGDTDDEDVVEDFDEDR